MIAIPDLETSLLDILDEIEGTDIKLIVGGGFGIYLKTNYVQRLDRHTLLQEWPEARSTNDIELYLRPELLIESGKLRPLSEAISRLGYQASASCISPKKAGAGSTAHSTPFTITCSKGDTLDR